MLSGHRRPTLRASAGNGAALLLTTWYDDEFAGHVCSPGSMPHAHSPVVRSRSKNQTRGPANALEPARSTCRPFSLAR
jgi:hypothetical protein